MYTLDLPILYSEESRGERISGQHTNCFHIPLRFSQNAVPVGFCCGGFSSTAGYVPGNEARVPKHASDFALFSRTFPKSVVRFYPDNSEKSRNFS
jgi:hypothetical protein